MMKNRWLSLKNLVLLTGVCALSFGSIAQTQIGNSDFENWDNLGNDTERPTNWNNMKNGDLCGLCSFGSIQTTWRDAGTRPGSTGSYSAKIVSGSALGGAITVNGNMTLGKLHAPSSTPSEGYNQSTTSDTQFSETFTGKPDSLVFWAKYSETTDADSARVSFTIHDNYDYIDPEDAASQNHWVAKAVLNFQTGGNWVRISVPFDYSGPVSTPMYILGTFASSYVPGDGVEGATLYVDDLEMIYNTPEASIAPTAVQNLIENQAGTMLTVTEGGTAQYPTSADSREWKYSTTSGSGYQSFGTPETGTTYTPQFATAGTYYVVCESTFGGNTITSNEVEVDVAPFTNSIAPTAVQNLVESQAGNTLTVTEAITADSREWKYSTTSGSGYMSFGTPETGTTYTPEFATAGTYYVVCESTFGGNTVTSNEVQVVVTAPITNIVSIAPNTVQQLIETQVGTTITASETPSAATSREWKWSTVSGSGYQSFGTPETGTTYTPQFATAGTYYVVCISDFGGGDIQTSNEVEIDVATFTSNIAPTAVQTINTNQAGTDLTVTESPVADSREWKYSETSGSGYMSFGTPETGTTYTPLFATAGTYYVVCESTIDGITITSNEVEIIVNQANAVSIAPIAAQQLIETQAGTALTASEIPAAAVSREWKWSETSGSGYQSFGTPETGTSYTPQFATAGTYYVVCVSDFGGGDIQTSNEVEIDVATFTTTIAPTADQTIVENETGTDLTVTESPVADSREWKYSTTSGSGYQSFATAETGTTYTPQFATAGTYYVVCSSVLDGISTVSNEVKIIVEEASGLTTLEKAGIKVYSVNHTLKVDLTNNNMKNPIVEVMGMDGRIIVRQPLKAKQMNDVVVNASKGIYIFRIRSNNEKYQGKIFLK